MTDKIADLPENYRPSGNEEYMNDLQLEYFRRKLLSWRRSLLSEFNKTVVNLGKQNLNESDLGDRASVESEVSFELRTRDRYRKLLKKIDAALQRIRTRHYGFCAKTFEPIGIKRLEARPVATLGVNAQEEYERTKRMYTDKWDD